MFDDAVRCSWSYRTELWMRRSGYGVRRWRTITVPELLTVQSATVLERVVHPAEDVARVDLSGTYLVRSERTVAPLGIASDSCLTLSSRCQDGCMGPASYLERLQGELAEIRATFGDIIRGSTIRYVNPNTSDSPIFFAGAADWGWGPSDAPSTAARMVLLQRYRDWFVRLKLLFPHPTPEVETKLNETNDFVESWLVRDDSWDWNIPQTVEKAEAVGNTRLAAFDDLLELAGHTPETTNLRVVPDTSALMRNPDMASYQRAFGTEPFTVHLVPPVLSELDDLKDRGKTQDVRDKAHAVDRRVKGLREGPAGPWGQLDEEHHRQVGSQGGRCSGGPRLAGPDGA